MPRIDWAPGAGRRGRPLRTVLGMGQKQGLVVLSVLAGLSILLAGYALLDTPGGHATSQNPGSAVGRDGSASGGAAPAPTPEVPADPAKAVRTLQASTQHYADMFAQGQSIVGHTRYSGQQAYGQAYTNPKSPAALFSAYRIKPNPEADTSFSAAAAAAGQAFGSHRPPAALATWSADMAKVRADLSAWVGVAQEYQTGVVGQPDLDAAAAKVSADLGTAKADAAAVGS